MGSTVRLRTFNRDRFGRLIVKVFYLPRKEREPSDGQRRSGGGVPAVPNRMRSQCLLACGVGSEAEAIGF
ncbi:hypothetical protein VZH09_02805 [Synechococcus elongatus IITB7]